MSQTAKCPVWQSDSYAHRIGSLRARAGLAVKIRAEFGDNGPKGGAGDLFGTSGGLPVNKSQLHPIWSRARAKVGRDDLRFHDLRHTGQTLAGLAGATEAELMQRMGHSTTAASRIYMHSTIDHSRAVAAALSEMAQVGNEVSLRPVKRRR